MLPSRSLHYGLPCPPLPKLPSTQSSALPWRESSADSDIVDEALVQMLSSSDGKKGLPAPLLPNHSDAHAAPLLFQDLLPEANQPSPLLFHSIRQPWVIPALCSDFSSALINPKSYRAFPPQTKWIENWINCLFPSNFSSPCYALLVNDHSTDQVRTLYLLCSNLPRVPVLLQHSVSHRASPFPSPVYFSALTSTSPTKLRTPGHFFLESHDGFIMVFSSPAAPKSLLHTEVWVILKL